MIEYPQKVLPVRFQFADLCGIEPLLCDLEREVDAIAADAIAAGASAAGAICFDRNQPHFCANAAWYGYDEYAGRSLKDRLCDLVGWDARHPGLRSAAAYDCAYEHLYERLPGCRDCGCL